MPAIDPLFLGGKHGDPYQTIRELLKDLLRKGQVKGSMVHDARVAALCLAHGVTEFWTADRDFSRFPGLPTRNPLQD